MVVTCTKVHGPELLKVADAQCLLVWAYRAHNIVDIMIAACCRGIWYISACTNAQHCIEQFVWLLCMMTEHISLVELTEYQMWPHRCQVQSHCYQSR
jgi:hypothetical protein